MAFTGTYIFIVLVFIIATARKKQLRDNGQSSRTRANTTGYQKRSSNRTAPGFEKVKTAGKSFNSKGQKQVEEYDKELLSYCESTLEPGRGISFHGLKPGTDELALLIKRNTMRERELERAIMREQNHTH